MKIEKINDRQICCIISHEDLKNNQIRLSELALGSAKAKIFFRDIMLKARNDCGFDGLNSPLMIEAVPQPPDSLKLIITKIKENENNESSENADGPEIHFQGVDGVLNLVRSLREKNNPTKEIPHPKAAPVSPEHAANTEHHVVEAFRFPDMDSVIVAARAMKDIYDGENSLYTEPAQETYLLTVRCSSETPEEFNKICNILTEYAIPVHCSESGEYYLKEHGNELIADCALQVLKKF